MRLHLIVTIGIVLCVAQLPSGIAQNSEPWKRHTIDASSLGADGVGSADVNADGLADLVTSWEEGGLTRVYLAGRADSGEPAWRTITVGKSPSAEDAVSSTLMAMASTTSSARQKVMTDGSWWIGRHHFAATHVMKNG
jgi:hypothetical protein